MEIFTEKVGGKHCPGFKFYNQKFHLRGFDTKKEAEYMEQQLGVFFSNYGLHIVRKFQGKLFEQAVSQLNELIDKTEIDD